MGNDEYFILQNTSYRDAREGKFFPPCYIIKTKDEQFDFDIYKDVPTSQDDDMFNRKPKWVSLRLYDWEGNFVTAAMLPKDINAQRFAYDENSKTAYFLDRQVEKFYKCELSEFEK